MKETVDVPPTVGILARGEPGLFRVREQCERIVADRLFRGSKRSSNFLRHVTECALSGHVHLLKERNLGTDLFGRPADYDTGEDSIVRVTANEVRKKLAQYYVSPGHESELRIELPAGSYVPKFQLEPPASELAFAPSVPSASRRWMGWMARLCFAFAALTLAGWTLLRTPADAVVGQFWAPILANPNPVLICSSSPDLYMIAPQARERHFSAHTAAYPFGPAHGTLPAEAALRGQDVVHLPGRYLAIGDAIAIAKLQGLFSSHRKASRIDIGSKISFSELRQTSVVLVGGYSTNRWAFPMTQGLRFVFQTDDNELKVVDTQSANRKWVLRGFALGKELHEDYAVVSRLVVSMSGGALISAAGITQHGTQAAAELLTNEIALGSAMAQAPADWRNRNVQIVVRTKVVDRTPGPPEVLAVHVW